MYNVQCTILCFFDLQLAMTIIYFKTDILYTVILRARPTYFIRKNMFNTRYILAEIPSPIFETARFEIHCHIFICGFNESTLERRLYVK